MTLIDHILYALCWLSFGMVHSLLSGATVRSGLGRLVGRWHRLTFNAVALVHLALILWAGRLLAGDDTAFALPEWLFWIMNAMVAGGLLLGAAALRSYRAGPFLGWAQLRGEGDDETELEIGGLHRWMRHPLYTAGFLLLWGLARSQLATATALWASLYFVIGSRIEERRLVARFGAAYRRYRAQTPAFFPRPGR
ncbi:methyltransferase family protein [Stakelama marina]|uniref:Isoprenylcysteine carboxylmethyltransferase family protein n=1 Tax=Stakelama marina TaxID=2826939 RepID=A0A8T4I9E9_9SPHN|nr:NnrU family protein [Stakelama marina]MBR0551257.1 isoprenylcysteine carboxylmethyltransferase family protein [Stakelama marina]